MKDGQNILPGTGRGTSRRLVEGASHKCCDRVGHGVDVCDNTLGGDADDAVALFAQETEAGLIALRTVCTVVRLAVDFDDQARFPTIKVDQIRPDRMLAAKLHARFPAA